MDFEILKPDKKNRKGKQMLIIGKKGQGKTYFAHKILDRFKNHVVFDFNDEYKNYKRYIPQNFDTDSLQMEFDLLLKKIIMPHIDKIDVLVIEEADMIFPNKDNLTSTQRALLNLNRHWGSTVIYITRRPQLINTNVPALSDYIVAFKLDDSNDLKRLQVLTPALVGQLMAMPSKTHEFLFYDGEYVIKDKV